MKGIRNKLKRSVPVIQSIPVHSGKRPPRILIMLFQLPLNGSPKAVPRHGTNLALLLGVRRLYSHLSVRKSRRSIPAVHGSVAVLYLRRQYFSRVPPNTYLPVTLNIAGAAFRTLLAKSFLSPFLMFI